MLALAIEFSRCSRWLAPRELNSVPGRRGSLLARPSPSRGSVLRLSSSRVDRVVSASTWCFADPRIRLPKLLRKEVIQPHLPVRLPCYDFTPIADPTFDGSLLAVGPPASGVTDFRGVTGGVYKARERIHPGVADPRLLATPPSWRRVSASNPNRDRLFGIRSPSQVCSPLYRPMSHVCSPRHKGHEDLTSSPPSSDLSPAVSYESPSLHAGNIGQGLRSLRDLTQHLTTRADDSHAPPVHRPRRAAVFLRHSCACQALVRFFASRRIKQHAPLLVRAPVNSFEF